MSCVANSGIKPGDWVEVRSAPEILATLDGDAALDGLPFMPEMLAHCGRQYQVYKRADKTCDTIHWTGLRRMERRRSICGCCAVTAPRKADVRRHVCCFGRRPGCGPCLAADQTPQTSPTRPPARTTPATLPRRPRPGWPQRQQTADATNGEVRYCCQATQLYQASSPLPWWEPKQYTRDVCSNNVPLGEVVPHGIAIAAFSKVLRRLTGRSFPSVAGTLKKTPTESLGLQPGEWVIVKSKEEILATLDHRGRNRGLSFDSEMLPFCGKRVRVLRRVERLIEESTGRMLEPAGVGIILENVFCLRAIGDPVLALSILIGVRYGCGGRKSKRHHTLPRRSPTSRPCPSESRTGDCQRASRMKFVPTTLAGAVSHRDGAICQRPGLLRASWCQREFADHGLDTALVQCSVSFSPKRGTFRGMHYQAAPHAEVKLVRCTRGTIFDVIVDLRPDSPTRFAWEGFELSAENHTALYIPKGLAHGFLTLVNDCEVFYQMSQFFEASAAAGVRWNDPRFAIAWPQAVTVISSRDANYPPWQDRA